MNPRQWSLAKESSLKVANGGPKVQKQAKDKRDGVINPQNYNFNFQYGKFWCSQNATNQPKSTIELATCAHVPSGTHWSTSSDIHQVGET